MLVDVSMQRVGMCEKWVAFYGQMLNLIHVFLKIIFFWFAVTN